MIKTKINEQKFRNETRSKEDNNFQIGISIVEVYRSLIPIDASYL